MTEACAPAPGNNYGAVRKIIHVDMDAFFASVEQRDNPLLKGKPVAVGGSPDKRGVVAAASYEARRFGIHSAMPSRTAIQRCPQLVFVRPRFEVYKEVSNKIREIFHRYTDLVEPLSLDEAYLDVTENKRGLPSATLIAGEIKQAIFEETNLTASAGISINKFLAKTASQVNKPNGLFLIPPEKAETYVETLAIEKFYGIGHVTAEKMRRLGITCGADLKARSEAELIKHFGKTGIFYYQIARGKDDRQVEPNRTRKSIGAEESYAVELETSEEFAGALQEIAVTLKERIDRHKALGHTITLKVKYADYQQVTRSRTTFEPIVEIADMLKHAGELLATTEVRERKARLLGLTISNLEEDGDEQSDCIQLTLTFA